MRLTAVSGAQHRGFTTDSSSGSCVRLRRRLGWRCVSGYLGWESRRCSSSRARHGKTPNAARKEARKRPGSRSANGSCPRSILALARRSAGSTVRCFRHQVFATRLRAVPCILRHHRTFALLLGKVQSNGGFLVCRSLPVARPTADLSQPCAPPALVHDMPGTPFRSPTDSH